jgi:hypothetical protein
MINYNELAIIIKLKKKERKSLVDDHQKWQTPEAGGGGEERGSKVQDYARHFVYVNSFGKENRRVKKKDRHALRSFAPCWFDYDVFFLARQPTHTPRGAEGTSGASRRYWRVVFRDGLRWNLWEIIVAAPEGVQKREEETARPLKSNDRGGGQRNPSRKSNYSACGRNFGKQNPIMGGIE